MNELALFAGAGGGLLASRLLDWRTVCAVEIEPYCRRVLMQRQNDGMLEPFPIWDDVRTFDGTAWRGKVDVVSAGFPCQPFSQAGKQRGADDPRNMWPATARILGEVRPQYALLENVPALITSGYFGTILGDLAEIGLDARWGVFSAAGCGAPHLRKRLFIVANACGIATGLEEHRSGRQARQPSSTSVSAVLRKDDGKASTEGFGASSDDVSDANLKRLPKSTREQLESVSGEVQTERRCQSSRIYPENKSRGWWKTEPAVGRVAHGLANRVDRLKAIGNGQVPSVVVRTWRELSKANMEG